MFSGIQEILVIVILFLGILFLPRILNRGEAKRPIINRPAIVISGKMRLAIAASVVWLAVIAALIPPLEKDLFRYLYLGVGPVALTWLMYWVVIGFRKR